MKKLLGYLILLFLGIAVQFSWSQYLSFHGISPNIILIVLVFVGLERGSLAALILGFIWGLAWDVISVDLFGANALLFTTIGYVSGKLSKKLNEDKVVNQIILTFIATVSYWVGLFFLYQIFGGGEYKLMFNYIMLIQPFYNMLIAPGIFFIGVMLLDEFNVKNETY